jgi:hypothetical protein
LLTYIQSEVAIRKSSFPFRGFSFSMSSSEPQKSLPLGPIQVSFSIPCNERDKWLKTFLHGFFWERGIGCSVEQVVHETSYSTEVLYEAFAQKAYEIQKELRLAILELFPNLTVPPTEEWRVEELT